MARSGGPRALSAPAPEPVSGSRRRRLWLGRLGHASALSGVPANRHPRPHVTVVRSEPMTIAMLIDTHCHLADPATIPTAPRSCDRAWAGRVAGSWRSASPALRRSAPSSLAAAEPRLPRRRPPPARGGRLAPSSARRLAGGMLRRPGGGRRRGDGSRLPLRPLPARRPSGLPSRRSSLWQPRPANRRSSMLGRPTTMWPPAARIRRPRHPALVQQRARALAGGAGPGPLCVVQRDGDLQELAAGPGDPGDPLDRLLVETDGPYLAPVPHRGRGTSRPSSGRWPSGSPRCAASPVEELIAATAANAVRVFGLSIPIAAEHAPRDAPFLPTSPSRRPPRCGPFRRWRRSSASVPDDILPYGRYKAKISAEAVAAAEAQGAGWCWSPASTRPPPARGRPRSPSA